VWNGNPIPSDSVRLLMPGAPAAIPRRRLGGYKVRRQRREFASNVMTPFGSERLPPFGWSHGRLRRLRIREESEVEAF